MKIAMGENHTEQTSPRVSFEFLFNPDAALQTENDIVFWGKQPQLSGSKWPEERQFAGVRDPLGLLSSTSAPLLGITRKPTDDLKSVRRVNSSPPSPGNFRSRSSWRKQRVWLAPKMDLRMELGDLRRRQSRRNKASLSLPTADGGKGAAPACAAGPSGMLRCGARFASALAMKASLALSCISPT